MMLITSKNYNNINLHLYKHVYLYYYLYNKTQPNKGRKCVCFILQDLLLFKNWCDCSKSGVSTPITRTLPCVA